MHKRPAGTFTKHPPKAMHGVTRLVSGKRYSLFVVDARNGDGERDFLAVDHGIMKAIMPPVPPVVVDLIGPVDVKGAAGNGGDSKKRKHK